jgi:hypothetical protein
VQARLTLDPAWPGKDAVLFYDNSGAEVKSEAAANFRVIFRNVAGPGFASDYFDTFRVAIERAPAKQELATWMLQRTRLAQGKPQAAP